ncbi:MAG TPA: cytochrome c maturation protein CcmE [Dehalococcoidia bacterium]
MFKKKRFIIGGIIILLALGYLGYTSFAGAATYYYKVNEVLAKGSSVIGENVRVEGHVATGSVQRESVGRLLKFTISDTVSGESLAVVYSGVVPDTFKADSDVVVEGSIGLDGVFQAQTIMTKCPSKYEPATQ